MVLIAEAEALQRRQPGERRELADAVVRKARGYGQRRQPRERRQVADAVAVRA